jgi:hypothetical protein
MDTKHEMSIATWHEIDDLLHKITDRANKLRDKEIFNWADLAIAKLRNLAIELQMEDQDSAA